MIAKGSREFRIPLEQLLDEIIRQRDEVSVPEMGAPSSRTRPAPRESARSSKSHAPIVGATNGYRSSASTWRSTWFTESTESRSPEIRSYSSKISNKRILMTA